MSKMTVIQLLNKIANGEESDTITEFEFDKRIWNFFKLQDSEFCVDEWLLNQDIVITKHKEIIEEDKKIKRIGKLNQVEDKQNLNNYMLRDKINEIIDKLNKERE